MSGAILFMIPKYYLTGVNSRIAVSFLLLEPPLPLTRPRIGCQSGRLYRRLPRQTPRRGGGVGVRTGHYGSDRKSLSALFLVDDFTTYIFPSWTFSTQSVCFVFRRKALQPNRISCF